MFCQKNGSENLGTPSDVWNAVYANNVYANNFYGDGSNLTGLPGGGITTPGADARYVNIDGDSMTGHLTISGGSYLYANDFLYGTNADFSSDLRVDGSAFLDGYTYLGSDTSDYVYIRGKVNQQVLPGGASIDIGSSGEPFDDVYADRFHGDGSNLTNLPIAGYVELGRITAQSTGDGDAIYVETSASGRRGIFAYASSTSGVSVGGKFHSDSTTAGYGVYAKGYHGVYGENLDASSYGYLGYPGRGVFGYSDGPYGGYFLTSTPEGAGVYGWNTSSSGKAFGGHFRTNSATGIALYARAQSGATPNFAASFEALSSKGTGLYSYGGQKGISAEAGNQIGSVALSAISLNGTTGTGIYTRGALIGITAEAIAQNGIGVTGISTSNLGYGGYFKDGPGNGYGLVAESSNYAARFIGDVTVEGDVYANNYYGDGSGLSNLNLGTTEAVLLGALIHQTTPNNYGAWISSSHNSGRGIYAQAIGTGSITNYGGYFQAAGDSGRGVYGHAGASSGINYGGYFTTDSPAGMGLFASNLGGGYAAKFGTGTVEVQGDLDVGGTLSKAAGTFLIDHPLDPANKVLRHSFVESPDMKNVYDGSIVLNNQGEAVIELPAYFEALNRDFRYQLTTIGGYAPVYIAQEISNNKFKIAGGKAGMKVCWQITGSRQDVYATDNPIIVEETKAVQGTYLYPRGFNKKHAKK